MEKQPHLETRVADGHIPAAPGSLLRGLYDLSYSCASRLAINIVHEPYFVGCSGEAFPGHLLGFADQVRRGAGACIGRGYMKFDAIPRDNVVRFECVKVAWFGLSSLHNKEIQARIAILHRAIEQLSSRNHFEHSSGCQSRLSRWARKGIAPKRPCR